MPPLRSSVPVWTVIVPSLSIAVSLVICPPASLIRWPAGPTRIRAPLELQLKNEKELAPSATVKSALMCRVGSLGGSPA